MTGEWKAAEPQVYRDTRPARPTTTVSARELIAHPRVVFRERVTGPQVGDVAGAHADRGGAGERDNQ